MCQPIGPGKRTIRIIDLCQCALRVWTILVISMFWASLYLRALAVVHAEIFFSRKGLMHAAAKFDVRGVER